MFDKKLILSILKEKQMSFIQLARVAHVPRNKNKEFSTFLFSLIKSGELFTSANREYFVPKIDASIEGIIRVNVKGFGFVDRDEDSSIFISSQNTKGAMDGDVVALDIFKDAMKEDAYQGIVKKIVTRTKTQFVGNLKEENGGFTITAHDQRIRGSIDVENSDELIDGHIAKVEFIRFEGKRLVKLIKIIGSQNDMSIDILSAIEDADIPHIFEEATLLEARKIPETIADEDKTGRTDLTDKLIFTIDGDDTKDFDDAIDISLKENGNYVLSVHIADVTHYVKEGAAIDLEAKKRGTSVYLADRVVPMLPESLSNGICSLNPNVDRFTLTCEMEIDSNGNTVEYKLYPSIINSKHRLTYKEVNDFYSGEKNFDSKELEDSLMLSKKLTKIIRSYKLKEGYIDFEIDESKIVIGKDGKTEKIVLRNRGESEMMIEDFMVRANETVAFNAFSKELPFIYRVHDKPETERLMLLQDVIDVLGLDVKIDLSKDPRKFAASIERLKEKKFDDYIKIMMLRTMAKAVYSSNNIGHFGLASETYTHFTSPIRRYPDLMVHRMIRTYFFEKQLNMADHFANILAPIAAASSEAEQKAVGLERKVADMKKAEFYEDKTGQSFKGTIVTIAKFGFFVELENKVAGLVHVSNLMDGRYSLDKTGFKLIGTNTYTVGEEIDVTVVGAKKAEGTIDFVVSTDYEAWVKANQTKIV